MPSPGAGRNSSGFAQRGMGSPGTALGTAGAMDGAGGTQTLPDPRGNSLAASPAVINIQLLLSWASWDGNIRQFGVEKRVQACRDGQGNTSQGSAPSSPELWEPWAGCRLPPTPRAAKLFPGLLPGHRHQSPGHSCSQSPA